MTVRKTVFWTHLITGVVAAIVVVMMSVTGVILTYERQIKEWANHNYYAIEAAGRDRLGVDELLVAANKAGVDVTSIVVPADPDALVIFAKGRRERTYADPYTGELLGPGNTSMSRFFSTMTGWHRWFDLSGDARATGRAFTGAVNLLFLFLLMSGIYIWLPPLWRWAVIRPRLAFNERAKTAKARDYNWHHVFGFWSLIPLFFIVIDDGTGGEPLKKRTLVIDRVTGDVIRTDSLADRTPAGRVLAYFRWLHTGEALGIVGQTIAGLVSALAVFMAWTGVALAYRRLIQPAVRRARKRRKTQVATGSLPN